MILGFKPRFKEFVRDGSKQHTLRDRRRGERQIVKGDRLDCYEKVRQKGMKIIGRWPCTRVQKARFYVAGELRINARVALGIEYVRMSIDGVQLSPDEEDRFAWRDGFRHPKKRGGYTLKTQGCFALMMTYWIEEGKEFPFEKDLFHWDFTKPQQKPAKAKRVAR